MKRKVKRVKFEDAETPVITVNNTNDTTSNMSGQTAMPTMNNQDNSSADDSMMDYILQQIKQNRDKQKQEDQNVFAYRQQQADKIVKDIEDYIKQNKNK